MMLRVITATETSPRGVLLAPGVALIILPGPAPQNGGSGISFRGQPLAAPFGSVNMTAGRTELRIAAVRLPIDPQGDAPLLIENGNGGHMPLYPSELDNDPLTIATELDGAARWRLLEFLLSFCRAAFRLGRSPTFAQLCLRLAVDCTRNAGIATVEAQVLSDRVLLSGMDVPHGSSLCIVRRNTVVHSTVPVREVGSLQIVPRVTADDIVVACGNDPAMWTVAEPATVPHVLALPENGRVPPAAARAAT